MKKIQVSTATTSQLDWLVMKCLGYVRTEHWAPQFCMDWSQMGPIIEREKINLEWWHMPQEWHACMNERLQYDGGEFVEGSDYHVHGPTPLIAAARCYVTSKLGETVLVPDELTPEELT